MCSGTTWCWRGNGSTLILLDNINETNISVGTRKECTEGEPVTRNITINNFILDGNRLKQTSEYSRKDPWIRNNNLDVRWTNGLTVNNLHTRNARSGGIVVSWYSSNMIFNNIQSYGHHFDGLAFYTSHSCIVSNFIVHTNDGAGISLDNDLRDSIFTNGVVRNNDDVGVFIRDVYNLTCSNLIIMNNKSNGIFLGDNYDTHRGPDCLHFTGCTVRGHGGVGVYNGAPVLGKHLSMQSCVLGPANLGGNMNLDFNNFTKSKDNVQFIK
ncbi:algE1 [Acrasis kona]|uniref:AlgE1 n=1 Tax=Acrasis kona TaxID=1008807 RepID=A0AAW2ZAG7_9EUKA